ncbi:MAG: tRNA-dihydrouridine synthase [Candidatus Latescibacterota bacterium]|nr:tRNA-dihydrouridine synthase [Candidatus Latescibacterota bacterium]
MRIGNFTFSPFNENLPVLTLAPMAGVGNWVFRLICAQLGARIVGVEFINCRSIETSSQKNLQLLDFSDASIYSKTGISALAAQIYGNDTELLAKGGREFERRGAQIVDINFGCSVPKIVKRGSGAAYLRDLDKLYRAVSQTVRSVSIPVTVKTRIGWDDDNINIVDVIKRCEDAGAKAVAIHARTVVQKYKGEAKWEWIARAKENAQIPIIGNGDVFSVADAIRLKAETNCDAVMIGRAAMANPWIFSGRDTATFRERIELACQQLELMAKFKGERIGVYETRKHLSLYFKQLPRTSKIRKQLLTTECLTTLLSLLRDSLEMEFTDKKSNDLSLTKKEAGALAWGGTD